MTLAGSNNFTGGLAGVISGSSGLQKFNISDNKITGAIPPSLGNAKYLQYVDMSANQLSNSIPDFFLSLPYMSSFLAEGNQLTGTTSFLSLEFALLPLVLKSQMHQEKCYIMSMRGCQSPEGPVLRIMRRRSILRCTGGESSALFGGMQVLSQIP